uniref:Uncharacterized protein n=1 Tax=Arundo donax TaxID=35708 RepID=A0A0A9FUG8_ARUDO
MYEECKSNRKFGKNG